VQPQRHAGQDDELLEPDSDLRTNMRSAPEPMTRGSKGQSGSLLAALRAVDKALTGYPQLSVVAC
jgi:hypothetical protein